MLYPNRLFDIKILTDSFYLFLFRQERRFTKWTRVVTAYVPFIYARGMEKMIAWQTPNNILVL